MTFDSTKAEQFADRLVGSLNDGMLCLMISIGHRTGLFDAMEGMAPATSEEIAQKAELDERYVREWLGAMTTGAIVDHDPVDGVFSLPNEHAGFLTRSSARDNIAVFAQYVAVLGQVEDEVVECFKNGGGVPYEKFPRFHEVMAEDSGQSVLSSLEEHIIPLVPGLADDLARGIDVLDVGCGAGRAINLLASRYPNSRFTGYDLSIDAIAEARAEASHRGLENVTFEVRDLSDFELSATSDAFDFVTTFDAVHDQARPLSVLRGIFKTLKASGTYLMQDIHGSSHVHGNIDHPLGPMLYTISCLHCMTVSLAQGGEGLGAMWGREKAQEMLEDAGFRSIDIHRLEHDFQNDYYVIQKALRGESALVAT